MLLDPIPNIRFSFLYYQANIKEIVLEIPHKFHNSIIGAKGRLIRSIMEECGGVIIRFPEAGSTSDKVTIRGPKDDVEAARKQLLELTNERVSFNFKKYCEIVVCILGKQTEKNNNIDISTKKQKASQHASSAKVVRNPKSILSKTIYIVFISSFTNS